MIGLIALMGIAMTLAIVVRLLRIPTNRLDAIALRSEVVVWIVMTLLVYFRPDSHIDSMWFLIITGFFMARFGACMSYIANHPYHTPRRRRADDFPKSQYPERRQQRAQQ